jgi:hypothetical protein
MKELVKDLIRERVIYPVWRANHGGTFAAIFSQLGTEPEITDLDLTMGIEEDVI